MREIFEQYREDRRRSPIPGFAIETLADVTRHAPTGEDKEAVLSFARLDAASADRRIAEELRWLRDRGWEGEWKVHDLDEPRDLRERLAAHGLAAHHVEALMVLDVASAPLTGAKCDPVVIERATAERLEDMAVMQEEVWQCSLPWLLGSLRAMSDPATGTAVVFCARDAGRVVGTGWIDFFDGSSFAQLSGGSVLERWRGRGVYTALFERRLVEAKARGVRWLAVDAAPMSRPILEKRGFRFVCNTYPMRTRPFDTKAVTRS